MSLSSTLSALSSELEEADELLVGQPAVGLWPSPERSHARLRCRRCSSTTRRSRATATRCGSCCAQLGIAYETVELSRRRPLEPGRGARRAEPGAARADARARRRPPARRVERDPLVLRRRHAARARATPTSARRCCSGMFFEQYSHEPTIAVVALLVAYSGDAGALRRADPGADDGRLRGARRDGAPPRRRGRSSSASATRSPTSRSTRTRTSRTRAASTSSRYPAIRAWLERVAAQPGHVPIDA